MHSVMDKSSYFFISAFADYSYACIYLTAAFSDLAKSNF